MLNDALRMAYICKLTLLDDLSPVYELFPNVEIFQKNNQLAFLIRNETETILAFRGTVNLSGWVLDIDIPLIETKEFPGKVHRGDYHAFQKLWPWIESKVKDEKNLILTGHSFGGALSILISSMLKNPVKVFTFGSPKVGDKEFTKQYSQTHHRFVNKTDIVPFLPLPIPFLGYGYHHCGKLHYMPSTMCPFKLIDVIRNHPIEAYIDSIKREIEIGVQKR